MLETSCQFPRFGLGGKNCPQTQSQVPVRYSSPPLHCGMLDLEGLRCQVPNPLCTDPISTFHSSLCKPGALSCQAQAKEHG